MHLLIDVRTSSLSDIPYLQYALSWAKIWKKHHKDDIITFLAYDGDPLDEGPDEKIFLSRDWSPFPKKLASHPYGPDRIISFSKSPQIDMSIPMLLHVSDLTSRLYPSSPLGFFEHRISEQRYKTLFHSAHHIIVPDREIGAHLGELYGVDESHISVIPYLSPEDKDRVKDRILLTPLLSGEYFITEGTPGEEWHPMELLRTFARYIYDHAGKKHLYIIGDLGANLGTIITLIRSLDLFDHVKLTGVLGESERSSLYAHAKGWIYIGHYYSRGGSASLASGYGIPLYISDIPGLRDYPGISLHPNHLDRLPEILKNEYKENQTPLKPNNDLIMEVYTRIIAS